MALIDKIVIEVKSPPVAPQVFADQRRTFVGAFFPGAAVGNAQFAFEPAELFLVLVEVRVQVYRNEIHAPPFETRVEIHRFGFGESMARDADLFARRHIFFEVEASLQHFVVKADQRGRIGMVSVALQSFDRGRMVFNRIAVRIGPELVFFQHGVVGAAQPCGVLFLGFVVVAAHHHAEIGSHAAVFAPPVRVGNETEFLHLVDEVVDIVAGLFEKSLPHQPFVDKIEVPIV